MSPTTAQRYDHTSTARLKGRAVLVLEDEPLVRLDVLNMMKSAGARVHSARTVGQALDIIRRHKLSAAVLDIKIDEADCSQVYEHLLERRIPVVLHTGYPRCHVSKTWPEISVVTKPSRSGTIVDTVVGLLEAAAIAAD